MSSVTRFIRQIPLATTYYNAPSNDASGITYYEFVPTSSNYVGNYPPGHMLASAAKIPSGSILRDMGKTFAAVISASGTTFNYYRQVQVLVPQGFTSGQLIGGVNGTTSGVIGDIFTPSGYAPYYTLYVQTTVAGLGVNSGLTPIIGGQM